MRSKLGRLTAAATALLLFNPWSVTMANDNPYAARSKALLPVTLDIDSKVADALSRKSLSDLQAIYGQLQDTAEKGETLVTDGGTACACDLAHVNLLIVIGFSINKLDGEGRYQDWMEDESLDLLAEYRKLVADCGGDAGSAAVSGITDGMLKAL